MLGIFFNNVEVVSSEEKLTAKIAKVLRKVRKEIFPMI